MRAFQTEKHHVCQISKKRGLTPFLFAVLLGSKKRGLTPFLFAVLLALGWLLPAPAQAQIAFRAASSASATAVAAPTFQAAGAAVSGIGSVTPAWPAHAVDDVALLFCESAGGQAVTLSTPNGFAAVASSPQSTTAGPSGGTRVTVFWARATSTSMPAPVVADPGDHVYCRILTYRGVIDSGNPWDVTGGGVDVLNSVTVTGVTTTVSNTRVVQAVSRDNDSAAAAFSAQTNPTLTGITERSDAGTTSGNGGGIGIWDGVKATAGATGNTTATVTPSINAFLTVALRPSGAAAPAFQAAGAAVSGTGSVTPAWPAHAVNDVALLFCESAGGQAVTLSTPNGFAAVANSPQSTGAGTAGTRISVFWARATSTSMAAPVVADPGDHVYCRILTYRGVITAGNPWDVTGGGVKDQVTVSGVTTTVLNTRVVQIVARDDDSAAAAFSAQTNANLTGITERSDAGTTSGNGGGFAIWDGVMAAAGATGNTTATVTSSVHAFLTIALRPAGLRITVPAGTVANDVMIAHIAWRTDATMTPPAGWTQVGATLIQPGAIAGVPNRLAVFYRVATAAEPASYSWNFPGGTLNGATGSILSYSGVDTSNPIDASAGALTPAATPYDHTAPSITPTTTNTMLVRSYAFPTSSDWNPNPPSASITERVDIASLAVPSTPGISMAVYEEPWPTATATGTRTARATDYGAGLTDAGDGTAHHLALRPVPGVPPPGDFNAFETSTAGGSITGRIYTKLAGTNFSLDVVAILSGAQHATFTDTVQVDLVTGSTGGLNCPGAPATIAGTTQNVNLTSGRGTTGAFNVANAYRDVRVRVRYPVASPTVTSCSTDNFSIRPTAFSSVTSNMTNSGTSGAPVAKAGDAFSITAVAGAGYDGTPGIDGTKITPHTGAVQAGSVGGAFGAANPVSGTATGSSFTYSEVGNFRIEINGVYDSAFTSVDPPGTDCTSDFSNSLVGGRYGCSFGNSAQTAAIGRFTPDHFDVSYNVPVFTPACSGFTYVGQAFSYSTAPVITVTARNSSGLGNAITRNYGGVWQKITNATLTYPGGTSRGYRTLSGTLDVSGVPGTDPVIAGGGAGSEGTVTLTFSSGTGLFFQRTTPVAPFDAEVSLAINVIDEDGIVYAANPAKFGNEIAGGGIVFSDMNPGTTNDKDVRFGRLRLGNANGSQLVPLSVPMETQYWNGSGFITNTADSCTTIAATNVAMSNFTQNLAACETAISVSGAFSAGRKTPQLAAPGSGNNGSVDLTVNLGSTGSGTTCTSVGGAPVPVAGANLLFLRGNWTGGAYDQNPAARASFGIYRGAEEVIFIRENF